MRQQKRIETTKSSKNDKISKGRLKAGRKGVGETNAKNGRHQANDRKNRRNEAENKEISYLQRKTSSKKVQESNCKDESKMKCPNQKKCGGCQYLHMTNEQQLAIKQKKAEELLKMYCPVHKIVGMKEPYHYRNKVHAVFSYQHGEVVSGTYAEGTHDIVPVETCLA